MSIICNGRRGALSAALAVAWLAGCATPDDRPSQPEASSTFRVGLSSVVANQHMAASAHPLASEAGREILRAGGSAVDAAIAIQMVLTLVEPQSSGIGGGAFLLHWDGRTVVAYDGRETAPLAADEKLFRITSHGSLPAPWASTSLHKPLVTNCGPYSGNSVR